MCHTSATTAILSPFFAETVIISGCISIGSCAFKVYPEDVVVTCIGGVRDGDGARLERAVGDSEEVVSLSELARDDCDADLEPGHATYGGAAEGVRPRGG